MDEMKQGFPLNGEISNSVIKDIVERATYQTVGVWRFSSRFYDDVVEEITERFGNKRRPGIGIKHQKNGEFEVNVYIIVTLSRNFLETAKELQSNIATALRLMAGLEASAINVSIEGVHFVEKGELSSDQ